MYWISNLLLGEKQVRASAPNLDSFLANSPADSLLNSGQTQWDALRVSHILASSKPFCLVMESLYDTARTYFIKNSWSLKVRVQWAISIPPRPSIRSTTARKGCPSTSAVSHRPRLHPAHASFVFARFWFSFFGMGVCRRGTGFSLREKLAEFKCGLGFAKTIFWGKGFGKTSAEFPARRKGSGEWMRAGLVFRIFRRRLICFPKNKFSIKWNQNLV